MLTRTECTAMRGLAIMAIALHNYCHFIGGIVQENEYLFSQKNNDRLWQLLAEPDRLLPVHLLSYLGHYGVPVFLFLSGLGLVLKYEAHERPSETAWQFCRRSYLKLLRLLVPGLALFVCADLLTPGRFHFEWQHVVAQLTMTINLLPTPEKIIWPGIYWFFGLMMELYVVYRLLLYRQSSRRVLLLMAVCWLAQACCTPDGEMLNQLRYNFVGAVVPFGAGIMVARHGSQLPQLSWPRWAWLAVSVAMLLIMLMLSLHFQSWLWAPLPAILCCVAMVRSLPPSLLTAATWLGTLSAAIFVTHPTARKLLIGIAHRDGIYDGLLLYVIVTIVLGWLFMQATTTR